MNNLETTKGALNRAKRWDDVIYSYQMTIKQALKGTGGSQMVS